MFSGLHNDAKPIQCHFEGLRVQDVRGVWRSAAWEEEIRTPVFANLAQYIIRWQILVDRRE